MRGARAVSLQNLRILFLRMQSIIGSDHEARSVHIIVLCRIYFAAPLATMFPPIINYCCFFVDGQ